jgi:predicted amidohydrolase YtcJ
VRIRPTANWQELNLAERRLRTAGELDHATDRHPVLVKRGGHNSVLNSCALRLAGITRDTSAPAGGEIDRDAEGNLTGRLIDNAQSLVERLVPPPAQAERIEGLRLASAQYAATGIGAVRDCAVSPDDFATLLSVAQAGALSTRVRALFPTFGLTSAAQVEDLLDSIEDWRYSADPWLGA